MIEGKCLCGAVGIALEAAQPDVDICHCRMCQRWTGAMYAGITGEQATITGEEHITAYRSSDWAERAFCSKCGSSLWYEFLPDGHRSYLAGLFDLPPGLPIKRQIFVDEKPDWFDIAQPSPMLTAAETIAEAKAAGFTFE